MFRLFYPWEWEWEWGVVNWSKRGLLRGLRIVFVIWFGSHGLLWGREVYGEQFPSFPLSLAIWLNILSTISQGL